MWFRLSKTWREEGVNIEGFRPEWCITTMIVEILHSGWKPLICNINNNNNNNNNNSNNNSNNNKSNLYIAIRH